VIYETVMAKRINQRDYMMIGEAIISLEHTGFYAVSL